MLPVYDFAVVHEENITNESVGVAGDFSSAKRAMAPEQMELPGYRRVYFSAIEVGLTFVFAFIVLNCVLSILIEVYITLRRRHHQLSSDAPPNSRDLVLVRPQYRYTRSHAASSGYGA